MKKKIVVLFTVVFTASIIFSYFWGGNVRDFLSAKVEVMSPVFYTFADGKSTMTGLSSSCFHTSDTETYAFIVEEKSDTGEKAYFVRKIDVTAGRTDDRCTELLKSSDFNAIYVALADKTINDGDRVVISKVLNSP